MTEKTEKTKDRKYGILIRVIAAILVIAMISSVLVYYQTDVTVNPQQEENKAVRLAARQLLADNDYANASRLERMSEYTRNLLRIKNSTASYQRAAEIEIAEGDYQAAISLTAKAIEAYSGHDAEEEAELYFQMGYLHVMENEYENAMKWLNLGLELKDSPEARLVRAQVRLNLKELDTDAALEDVVAYMNMAEDAGENLPDLINVYEAAGDYRTAAIMYTRLLETNPDPDYYLHRAYCYVSMAQAEQDPSEMGNAVADREAYEQAGGKDLATADVMLGIGWMRMERYPEAGKSFIAALNEGYKDPESLYYYIVLCSYVSENFAQACTYGDQMIERISRGEDLTAAEMGLENTTGRMKVKLVEIDFPFLCRMTGASHMKTGDFEQAEECLPVCLNENPDMPYANYLRGVCRMVAKRYAEAEADFTRAIAGEVETETSYYSRAICRIKLENTEGTMEDLDWILLHGTNEELFQDASGMMNQLLAGEIPVID